MKDILYGLIGIIAALVIFAGGVIIGAGYLKAALDGAGEETTQNTSTGAVTPSSGAAAGGTETYAAGGNATPLQTISYPQTSVITLESATPPAEQMRAAGTASPAGTPSAEATTTGEGDRGRTLSPPKNFAKISQISRILLKVFLDFL